MNDDDLRQLWRDAGGEFHGPLIERGTITEVKLLSFLRALQTNAEREKARADANEKERDAFRNDASWIEAQRHKNHSQIWYDSLKKAEAERDAARKIIRDAASKIDPECPDLDAYVDGHCDLEDAVDRLREQRDAARAEVAAAAEVRAAILRDHDRMQALATESVDNNKKIASGVDAMKLAHGHACALLEKLIDADECRLDHHGLCQTHRLENPCSVAAARVFLTSGRRL